MSIKVDINDHIGNNKLVNCNPKYNLYSFEPKIEINKNVKFYGKIDNLGIVKCSKCENLNLYDVDCTEIRYTQHGDPKTHILPKNLQILHIYHCKNMRNLCELPKTLTNLYINYYETYIMGYIASSYIGKLDMESFPKLPPNINLKFKGTIEKDLEYNPDVTFGPNSDFSFDIDGYPEIINNQRRYDKYMQYLKNKQIKEEDNPTINSIKSIETNNNEINQDYCIDKNLNFNCKKLIDCYHCYISNECISCNYCINCNQCKNISFLKNISNYDAKPYLDYCKENISDECIMKLYELSEDINENIFIIDKNILQLELIEFMEEDIEIYKKFLLGFKEIIYLLIHIYKFPKELFPNELI